MTTVAFPARCAVAVVCGKYLVSQVYPASVPVEVFLDDIVDLLNDDLKRRGAPGLEGGTGYELQRPNGIRLDATKTLDELGVEDGATLVLAPAGEGESFEPQYESLSTGLARVGRRLFAPVTAHTAAMTALAILGMAVTATVGLAARTRLQTDSWAVAVVLVALGAMTAAGGVSLSTWWPERWQLSGGLGWLSVPLLSVGLAAAAPGRVGAAHLFIGALAAAVLICGLVAVSARYLTVAATAVTLCTIGGTLAAVRMWLPVPAPRLGLCTLVGLLFLITASPTVALWVARIRPPHFGSITGRDLFRRNDGMPVDAVAPVDEESDPDPTPSGAEIAAAARRANSVLTGICVAAAAALPPAVWAALSPGEPRGAGALAVAALVVLIYISRGRAFADRRQAVALVCGAAAAVCIAVTRYVLLRPAEDVAPLVWAVLVLIAFACSGLAVALIVPATRFTPLVRMAAEWLELIAVVLALPLAGWVGGLFAWVRMR